MSQVTVGENILGIVLTVAIISAFTVVLGKSYSNYQNHKRNSEKSEKLLQLTDSIRYNTINGKENNSDPYIIKETVLEKYGESNEISIFHGSKFSIKLFSLENNALLKSIGENIKKSSLSLSFPVVYETRNIRKPARFIVKMD